MLPKHLRLRHTLDFERLRRKNNTRSNAQVILSYAPNNLSHNRYGFITAKYLGYAVRRNRIKRQMRETIRYFLTYSLQDNTLSPSVRIVPPHNQSEVTITRQHVLSPLLTWHDDDTQHIIQLIQIKQGYDMVFIARKGINQRPYATIMRGMWDVMKRANLVQGIVDKRSS